MLPPKKKGFFGIIRLGRCSGFIILFLAAQDYKMAKIHIIYLDIDTGYFPDLHHGLASLAASVSQKGHSFSLHHLSAPLPPGRVAEKALAVEADLIGFSLTTNQRKYLDRYSAAISQRSNLVQIAGGIHPTIAPQDVLACKSIRGVCIGEAERALPLLLDRIDSNKPIFDTPDFWFRDARGEIVQNPIMPLEANISRLAYPDYSIFDTQRIIACNSGWMGIMVTRGCPYDCSYCCNHLLRSIYPNKNEYVRFPTADYALELIKRNLSLYRHIKGINFADDLLLFNEGWFGEFIIKYHQEIKLPFICNARAASLTDQVCSLLKENGCILVRIGIESGNEELRRSLLKRYESNAQITEAFRRLKNLNVSTFSYNILGFPFETEPQMRETFWLNKAIKPDMGTCFYFFPYPGTHLYNLCRESGLLLDSSKEMSGYFQGVSIKLTHCSVKACKKIYNQLRLYLLTRSLRKKIGFLSGVIYLICKICPEFFVKLFTRRSRLKNLFRKIFYKQLFYQ